MVRDVGSAVVIWLLLGGLYLFFAGSVDVVEGAAAVIFGGLGAGLGLLMMRAAKLRFSLAVAPRAIVRPLLSLLPDFVAVARALGRAALSGASRPLGDFTHQPFDAGDNDDPRTATRRAAVLIGMSFAPRTIVVRAEDGSVLLHGLPAKPPSTDHRWPA